MSLVAEWGVMVAGGKSGKVYSCGECHDAVLAPGQVTLPWAIRTIVLPSDGQLPLLWLRTRLWQSRDELAGGGRSEVADSARLPVALSIALLRGHRIVVGGFRA
jgi:hypothetical protein